MEVLATITIGIDPDFDFGPFTLSWHGLLTFIAVAVSVFLAVRWGTREGLVADSIYSVAVWGIIGGVVGARLIHVVGQWGEFYGQDPIRVLYVWQGGVAIFGAILGGFVGGALYIIIRNSTWYLGLWARYFKFLGKSKKAPLPGVGRLADIAAPAMLISQAIGRVGDIINGEHFADPSSLPWAVVYTHPDSPGLRSPTHPAVAYELLMDLAILGLLWPLRKRLRPDGMLFALYLGSYSVGRFFLSFLRVDKEYGGLNQAQIIALIVIVITVPLLSEKSRCEQGIPPHRKGSRLQLSFGTHFRWTAGRTVRARCR